MSLADETSIPVGAGSCPRFARVLETFGPKTAIIDEQGRDISYQALAAMADEAVAHWGSERRLLLLETENTLVPLAIYLGALRAGHPVILTASGEPARIARVLDRFRPDLVVGAEHAGSNAAVQGQPANDLHPDLALLLPTSGSTGEPKLVRLSRTNLDSNAQQIAEYLQLGGDRAITSLPWHYSYGLSVVHSYLASGCTLVLTDLSVGDPSFFDHFEQQGCTSFAGVPYSFDLLERSGFLERPPPSRLRYFTVAGGRLPPEKVGLFARWADRHNLQFFVMYGQTEASPRIAYLPPELAARNSDAIGISVPGGALSIEDQNGCPIPGPDVVGELVYRGPNVMMGYARSRADLACGAEVPELRTGDLASRNSAGLFRIAGRASRFSKLFGLRINLDDVEDQLAEDGVSARVAGDDSLIAVMAPPEADAEEIELGLSRRLGLPRPAIVVVIAQHFPLLPSGKIDYAAVLESGRLQLASRQGQMDAETPGSTRLGQRLAYVLGRERLDAASSYVELGADSLTYVQASMVVEDELGFLPDGWEEIPISELERRAGERQHGPPKRLAGLASIESSVLLRAVAILGVVLAHCHHPEIAGGAYLLLALSGTLFARLRRGKLIRGKVLAAALPPLIRIVAAYYFVMLAYQLGRGNVDIRHWLLVANFSPNLQSEHTLLPYYWFIPNFVQTVLLYAGLFALPFYRRAARTQPWEVGLVTLAFAFGVALIGHLIIGRADGLGQFTQGHFTTRTPMFLFYLFAFGWCIAFAETNARRLVLTAAAIVMIPVIGVAQYAAWLIVGTLFTIWVPRARIPAFLRGPTAAVAGAAFYIFIVHMIPVQAYRNLANPNPILTACTILVAVVAGIGLGWAIRKAELLVRRLAESRLTPANE